MTEIMSCMGCTKSCSTCEKCSGDDNCNLTVLGKDMAVDWATPSKIFDELNNEFNFTCDLAASDMNHKHKHYYTKENSAFDVEWTGVCWLNPPWSGSGALVKWLKKAYESDATVVCLIPKKEGTGWWRDYCLNAQEIRELDEPLIATGCKNGKQRDLIIVIFGPKKEGSVTRRSLHLKQCGGNKNKNKNNN